MAKVYVAVDELWELLKEYKERNIEWGVPYLMNAGINQAIMALNKLAEKNGKIITED